MSGATSWGEYELLCEQCGYSILGLPTDGVCPECGLNIQESLAARAAGSPWQQHPSLRTWLRTVVLMIVRPRSTLAGVSFDNEDRNYPLLVCNVLIPPGVISLGLGCFGVGWGLWSVPYEELVNASFAFCLFWAVATIFCMLASFCLGFLLFACSSGLLGVLRPLRLRGGEALVIHATCILVPTGLAIAVSSIALIWFEVSSPLLAVLAVLATGVVWFGALCLVGTSWHRRTPAASGE